MGQFFHIGFWPNQDSILPKGYHNMFPEEIRPYIPTYPMTVNPFLLTYYEWSFLTIYPLGMKAFPDHLFTSDKRKMYRAILNTDIKEMERLLDKGFDMNQEVVPHYGYTALGMAAALNLLESIHYLTLRGANYEHPIGRYKKTALHLAVEHGNELATKYLLNNGANVNTLDLFGFNIYDKAEYRGYYDYKRIFDYFKEHPKERKIGDFEEYRYTSSMILENPDTFDFKPSELIEVSPFVDLKYENTSVYTEKFNLDKFSVSFINQYDIQKFKGLNKHPRNTKDTYKNLDYYQI